jgi:hypothetical protein
MQITIGQQLIPAFQEMTKATAEAVKAFQEFERAYLASASNVVELDLELGPERETFFDGEEPRWK